MKLSKSQLLVLLYLILVVILCFTGLTVYNHFEYTNPSAQTLSRYIAPALLIFSGLVIRIAQLHWQIRNNN